MAGRVRVRRVAPGGTKRAVGRVSERELPRGRILRFVDPVVPKLARHPVKLELVSARPTFLRGGLTHSRGLLERLALQVLDAFRQTQGTRVAGFTQRSPRRLLEEHPRIAEELVGPPPHAESRPLPRGNLLERKFEDGTGAFGESRASPGRAVGEFVTSEATRGKRSATVRASVRSRRAV